MIRYVATLALVVPIVVFATTKNTGNCESHKKVLAACKKHCENKKKLSQSPWKGSNVGAGAVINTGNTKSQSYNVQSNISYRYDQWLFTGLQTYQRNSSSSKGVTADKLYLQGQAQYNFLTKDFAFTQLNYTDDRFDGYNYTANLIMGYGKNITVPKNMSLSLQGGPGIQRTAVRDTGKTHNFPILHASATYAWQINDRVQFKENLQSDISNSNTRTTSTTSLSTNLLSNISFQVNFQVINDTDPQPDKSAWNTVTTLNLVYTFGHRSDNAFLPA